MAEMIDIRGLKKWVAENYPHRSALNQVLQMEKDKMNFVQYRERGLVWLKLARIESDKSR